MFRAMCPGYGVSMRPQSKTGRAPGAGPELLAPAGGPEAAHAALRYGADAVYIGLSRFSARAEAVNFTPEQADSLIAHAHGLAPRRRVYVALNTLVRNDELPGVAEALGLVSELGADAVIAQDLGVLRLARRYFPELRLHASTQMAIHNRAGVEMAAGLGFARATLARELTLGEIRDCARVPGIEVETFIHGALCYSYSGLCLFSSFALGRSGNRGRCAYLCRDRFQAGPGGGGGLLCSMKDLDLSAWAGALREAGVAAFKIEGRMKSPLYVAAAVSFYRRLLDGALSKPEREAALRDIRSVFSRPVTELSIAGPAHTGLVDALHGGHRGVPIGTIGALIANGAGRKAIRFCAELALERHDGLQVEIPGVDEPFGFPVDSLKVGGRNVFRADAGSTVEVELPEGAPVLKPRMPVFRSSSQEVKRRYPVVGLAQAARLRTRTRVEIALTLEPGRMVAEGRTLAGPATVEALAERKGMLGPASDPGRMEAAAHEAFGKLGNTRFELGAFKLCNPTGAFAPVSLLNGLRRELVERLETALAAAKSARLARICAESCAPESRASGSGAGALGWSVKADDPCALADFEPSDWAGLEEVTLEARPGPGFRKNLEAVAERAGRQRVRLALPLLVRAWERAALEKLIRELLAAGWSKWEAPGLGAWPMLKRLGGLDLDWAADWTVYALNRQAVLQAFELGARRVTLSPEDGLDNLKGLLAEFGARATIVVFQDTPLMISESCIRANSLGQCGGDRSACSEPMELAAPRADKMLAITRECRTILLNRRPFCLAFKLDELRAAGAGHVRADFVNRAWPARSAAEAWRKLRAGEAPGPWHAANIERVLQ